MFAHEDKLKQILQLHPYPQGREIAMRYIKDNKIPCRIVREIDNKLGVIYPFNIEIEHILRIDSSVDGRIFTTYMFRNSRTLMEEYIITLCSLDKRHRYTFMVDLRDDFKKKCRKFISSFTSMPREISIDELVSILESFVGYMELGPFYLTTDIWDV